MLPSLDSGRIEDGGGEVLLKPVKRVQSDEPWSPTLLYKTEEKKEKEGASQEREKRRLN